MHLDLPLWFEVTSLVVLTLILIGDLYVVVHRPHIPTMRESGLWVSFYVFLALVFAGAIWIFAGGEWAGQFVAGWLTEYSLSVDNLFVFILIMARFAVPRKLQQEVLMVGIIIALVLRGIFILLGAALIENFSWVFYLFGAFLVFTAVKQSFGSESDSADESFVVRAMRKRVRVTDSYAGLKLTTHHNGIKHYTPMLLVLLAIGTTDLLFALDSIPAIFGITQSAFIVFTANVFALMGLRQLYFLLGGLLERLEYLKYGIAFILAFIGLKLFFHALHANEVPFINGGQSVEWAPEISTWLSLGVIVAAMAIATIASLAKANRDARRRGHELADEVPHFTAD